MAKLVIVSDAEFSRIEGLMCDDQVVIVAQSAVPSIGDEQDFLDSLESTGFTVGSVQVVLVDEHHYLIGG